MRIAAGIAVAAGAIAAVAFGGIAMAAETDPIVPSETTAPADTLPEGEAGSGPDDPAAMPGGGLACVLVPIEGAESVDGGGSEASTPDDTVAGLLAANEIECSGTGNERSAGVALVPRYLAHSDELSGAERGAAISEWAKTHANRKADDGDEPVVEGESPEDADAPSDQASPGRSGEAPGRSGSQPGAGHGR